MTTNIYTWWSSRRYGLGCHVPMMRLNLQLVGITLLWLVGLNVGWNCLESRCIVGSRDQWYFPSIFPLTVPRGALTAGKLPAALRWRHIGRDSVSNHLPHDCLLNRLFRRRSKKTSNHRPFAGNSPRTDEFPAQMASNAENVSIWWRHHALGVCKAIV